VFGAARASLEFIIEKTIAPNAELTREVWNLTRPPVRPSALRYAAQFTPSPWALSLLSELGPGIRSFVPAGAEPAGLERVREALTVGLILAFPLSPPAGAATYAFEHTLYGAAAAWADGVGAGDTAEVLRKMVECNRHLADTERLLAELRGVAESNEAGQFMVARSFRALAYLGALPPAPVRECVWDPAWRRGILSGLSQQALSTLWDGLAELQMQWGGEWATTQPHFWAVLCEEEMAGDRRPLLFALTVLGCLTAGSTSALRRLLSDPGRRFAEEAAKWRQLCEDAIGQAPPWPAAKLRAFVAELEAPMRHAAPEEGLDRGT
jgi:hypothetical protein